VSQPLWANPRRKRTRTRKGGQTVEEEEELYISARFLFSIKGQNKYPENYGSLQTQLSDLSMVGKQGRLGRRAAGWRSLAYSIHVMIWKWMWSSGYETGFLYN